MTAAQSGHTATLHANISGQLVLIGLGAVGRGLLPMIERHIGFDKSRFFVIDPDENCRTILDAHGITHIRQAVLHDNYTDLLTRLLTADAGQSLCINLGTDVSTIDLINLCRKHNALYVDASVEPWRGFYQDRDMSVAERSVYALRESLLAEKEKGAGCVTAVSCCGANPGLVSWLVKQAVLDLARDLGLQRAAPSTRLQWAELMRDCGVKGVHISERDTQLASFPKQMNTFVNTWSPDGMIAEATQPAELGWGTHEKWMPDDAHRYERGCKAAIYLMRPGGSTRVRTWCPTPGAQLGFLVPHNEAISIADYFTIGAGDHPQYRPTCHYAYHPCNHALLSLNEMFGYEAQPQDEYITLGPQDIVEGGDELGVLLYGHAKNAYWYGSYLKNEDAVNIAPYQNATAMQVSSGVLAGIVWALENPRAGVVEPEDMDFRRCLEVQRPYLGDVFGVYTDWTPITGRPSFFPEDLDEEDPWQFKNVLV